MSVAAALAAQNARLPPSPARDAHLRALAGGARAVVTGQQVGLFLGPLYTLHKAATAIRLARAEGAVPVFWLQTEDHDLVEIASVGLPGRTISVPVAEGRVSIAHLALPDAVTGALADLGAELGGHVGAETHLARLARHYRPGVRWSDAFAGVLAELFAELVFLDPRDPALAVAARPVHARAVADCARIAAALRPGPVHVRPGAPLSYLHPDGPEGPRYRLEPDGAGFKEVGGGRCHTGAALLAALDAEPRALSSSALLRPIVQDTLLRTVAYVGGPAEVAYFAQIEPVWPLFDLPRPRVVRRSSFRLVPAAARRQLERLGLQPADLGSPEDELLPAATTPDVTRRLLAPFEAALAGLELAPDLARAAERTRRSVGNAVERFGRKVERAARHRDAERVERVRKLKAILHPGAPQERVLGLPWFAARHGDREVAERLLAAVDLSDPGMKDVDL